MIVQAELTDRVTGRTVVVDLEVTAANECGDVRMEFRDYALVCGQQDLITAARKAELYTKADKAAIAHYEEREP